MAVVDGVEVSGWVCEKQYRRNRTSSAVGLNNYGSFSKMVRVLAKVWWLRKSWVL